MKLWRHPSYNSCWNSWWCLLKAKPPAKATSCADFLGGWFALGHTDSTPKYKPVLVPAHSAQVLFIHRHLSQLLEPHFPVRSTCLGEGRSKNSVCPHPPASPIPMSTPVLPLLNLAMVPQIQPQRVQQLCRTEAPALC